MLNKWYGIVTFLSFLLLCTICVFGQVYVYDILFSVEGPLDGSTNPAPLDEGAIYRHADGGASPQLVVGGSNAELLQGFEGYSPSPVGLDGIDVISVTPVQPVGVWACYWSSEIDFAAFQPVNTQPISNGDILAKTAGYYIENQTLRWPFKFADIPETEDVGLDALDVEGVDEALYLLMSEWAGAGTDRALGSTGGMIYTPKFSEFAALSREFWVFWSFELNSEPHILTTGHLVYNPYDGSLLPAGTVITADDLLLTVFNNTGPYKGYLVRTGRDGLPVTAPQIESLFEGSPHKGQSNIGLDAVAIPDIPDGSILGDLMPIIPFIYGCDEKDETGAIKHADISNKILFSTEDDASSPAPTFTNGDVLALQVNAGVANDVFQGVLVNTQSGIGHPVDNPDLTNLTDFNRGVDGLDLVPYGLLPIKDWTLY